MNMVPKENSSKEYFKLSYEVAFVILLEAIEPSMCMNL